MRRMLLLAATLLAATFPGPTQSTEDENPKDRVVVNQVGVSESSGHTRSLALSTSPYSGFHWPRSSGNQAYIRVIFDAPEEYRGVVEEAMWAWSLSGRIQFAWAESGSCPNWTPQRNCVWVKDWYEDTEYVAKTVIWAAGTHVYTDPGLYETTTYFNTKYGPDKNAACHELGHTLGLDHPEDGSQGPCVEVPKLEDYSMLRSIYAHVDDSGPPGWR